MSKPASAEGQARAPRGAKRFISGVVEGEHTEAQELHREVHLGEL